MPTAIITGASRGLGLALARALADRSWNLVLDARGAEALEQAAGELSDESHRRALVDAAAELGGPDLLVNNASLLGPSPQPRLADYPLDDFRAVYEVNVTAPLALIQAALPLLSQSPQGRILNITSDAGVEGYEGWGGYGSLKAGPPEPPQGVSP